MEPVTNCYGMQHVGWTAGQLGRKPRRCQRDRRLQLDDDLALGARQQPALLDSGLRPGLAA